MTLVAYLAGSDKAHNIRLAGAGLTARADGTAGFGGITFDDPIGDLVVRGWMEVLVMETACTDAPVLGRGLIADRTIGRQGPDGTYTAGEARWIDSNIVDGNEVLTIRPITDSTGKRPAETDIERLDWLLGSAYLSGLVDDLGLVIRTHPRPFDEADYRDQFPTDVIQDVAAPIGRTFFVYFTQPDGDFGLFYGPPEVTVGTSDLSISNDMADNSSTCFYPSIDAQLGSDPSSVVSAVDYRYRNGRVIEHNETTYATFFAAAATGGLDLGERGMVVSNDRIGATSSARSAADGLLDKNSVEAETVTVSIIVPKEQVGLIAAGQRIAVKFTHLTTEGLGDFTYLRVTARTVRQWITVDDYLVTLELSNYGVKGTGGGGGSGPGPGGFPTPPPDVPTVVQDVFAFVDSTPVAGVVHLPAPPSVGNMFVAFVTHRGGAAPGMPAGWTAHSHGTITPGSDYAVMWYRLVDVTDTAAVRVATSNAGYAQLWEITGTAAPTVESYADVDTGTKPATVNAGTVAIGAASLVLAGICVHCSDWAGNGPMTFGTDAVYATDGVYNVTNNGDLHPNVWGGHADAAAAGSFGPVLTLTGGGNNFGGWGGLQMSFAGTASDNPPSPGQQVPFEVPTLDVNGPATTYTTAHPFADGTLRVYVDKIDQTAAVTSYDGSCGSFTVGFTLQTGQLLEVRYDGR